MKLLLHSSNEKAVNEFLDTVKEQGYTIKGYETDYTSITVEVMQTLSATEKSKLREGWANTLFKVDPN